MIADETIETGEVVYIKDNGKVGKHPHSIERAVFYAPVDIKEDDVIEMDWITRTVKRITRNNEVIFEDK